MSEELYKLENHITDLKYKVIALYGDVMELVNIMENLIYKINDSEKFNLKLFEDKIKSIVRSLPKDYLEEFMTSFISATQKSIDNNNTSEIEQTLADWEFTIEVIKDPKLKQEINKAINEGHSKKTASLNDILKTIRN